MGNLPKARTITLNPGDPLPSLLIDEIQDQIITTNTMTITLGGADFVVVAGSGIDYSFADIRGSGGTLELRGGLQIPVGRWITAARLTCTDNVTGPTKVSFSLVSRNAGGSAVIGTSALSAGTGATQQLSIPAGLPVQVAAGTTYQLKFATSAGAAQVVLVEAEVDLAIQL